MSHETSYIYIIYTDQRNPHLHQQYKHYYYNSLLMRLSHCHQGHFIFITVQDAVEGENNSDSSACIKRTKRREKKEEKVICEKN